MNVKEVMIIWIYIEKKSLKSLTRTAGICGKAEEIGGLFRTSRFDQGFWAKSQSHVLLAAAGKGEILGSWFLNVSMAITSKLNNIENYTKKKLKYYKNMIWHKKKI